MEWQPIETAPVDGTWLMAYRPPAKGVCMDTIIFVRWHHFDDHGGSWMWPDEPYDVTTAEGQTDALAEIANGSRNWDNSFTHWMPLPPPPTV